jgi:asparagine synthase (glutamine-hydrolysing)
MCGIVGWIGSGASREEFAQKLNLLRHRGPDGDGIWEDREHGVLLGHQRLAIIDLSPSGAQPMQDSTGRWTIVFNGEIYNFQELRTDLEAVGVGFRSRSDTEVLLEAYKHWGEACLQRLNGMFAFAIYDRGNPQEPPSLFLARDRAGKKPLYFLHRNGMLRFASELKALGHDGGLDLKALNHYLTFGSYPGELCFQEDVRKLRPGFSATFLPLGGSWRETCWWRLPDDPPADHGDPEALTDELAALLTDSVRLRLISDVPVGVFLSGGLDSSLVTAAAARVASTPVKTFTIRVPATGFDESGYARIVARHFDTDHHELEANAATLDLLDEMEEWFDEPLADSSIIPTYLVSRLTRRHVTVALGGDGGDELFAGYSHFRRALVGRRIGGRVPPPVWAGLAALAARIPVGVKGRTRVMSWREGPWLERVWSTAFYDSAVRERLFKPAVLGALGAEFGAPERRQRAALIESTDLVHAFCHLDFSTTLADDFLVKVDRASMMSSLEVRAPFLDARLIDFAFKRVPSMWKCDGHQTRRLQRRLAQRWLPRELDVDRKQGFSIPLGDWFRRAGPQAIRDRLEGLPDVFDQRVIDSQIQGQMAGRENGSRLFALVMLAACCRRMKRVERDSPTHVEISA